MALGDLSFKLYNDSDLTSAFSGIISTIHQTDLGDGDQDFVLYLGSLTIGRKIEANSNPGVDQITLTPTDTLAEWIAATAYAVGFLIQPTSNNGLKYRCTTTGTSHASVEPTWPTSGIGSTVTDGTIVWTLIGDKHETTEIKLAATSGGLSGATPGALLNLGTSIVDGTSNAAEINIRVTNAAVNVTDNTAYAEISLFINEVIETKDL